MSGRFPSARDRKTLAAGALAVVTIVGVARAVPHARRLVEEAREGASAAHREAMAALGSVAGARSVSDSLQARNARFLALAPQLVAGDTPALATAELAGMISAAAAGSNVRIGALQLRSDSAGHGTFRRVTVRASLTGDIRGLAALLAALERGPTLLSVRELAITQPEPAAGDDRPESLRAEVVVDGLALSAPHGGER